MTAIPSIMSTLIYAILTLLMTPYRVIWYNEHILPAAYILALFRPHCFFGKIFQAEEPVTEYVGILVLKYKIYFLQSLTSSSCKMGILQGARYNSVVVVSKPLT